MKTGKTSAATLGLVGGLVLGAWIGSELTTSRANAPEPPAVTDRRLLKSRGGGGARQAEARDTRDPCRPRGLGGAVEAPTPESTPRLVMTIPVSAPELHARMKPVLARGTKLPLAVEGFTSAEQFATLAHAARNTQVPFILLKHRVLTEGQSLEEAIRASKPDIDARIGSAAARRAKRKRTSCR